MSARESTGREGDPYGQSRSPEMGRVRHFKMVGKERKERKEIFDEVPPQEPEPPGECVPCQLDEAIAIFGNENL